MTEENTLVTEEQDVIIAPAEIEDNAHENGVSESQEGGNPSPESNDQADPSQPPKRNERLEKRIGKLTGTIGSLSRQLTDRDQQIVQLQQQIAELSRNVKPEAKPDFRDPKYKDIEEYNSDLIAWHEKQNKTPGKQPEPQQTYPAQPQSNPWVSAIDDYSKVDPRIKNLNPDSLNFLDHFPNIASALNETYNPQLLLHVLDNRDEIIADLHDLSPTRVAIELGKIESSLPKPTVQKKTSSAPPPIKPVAGNGAKPAKNIRELSADDYYRTRYPT